MKNTLVNTFYCILIPRSAAKVSVLEFYSVLEYSILKVLPANPYVIKVVGYRVLTCKWDLHIFLQIEGQYKLFQDHKGMDYMGQAHLHIFDLNILGLICKKYRILINY